MSDCPHCGWRYDSTAACVLARPTGEAMPLLYEGGRIRLGRGDEAPRPRAAAVAAHLAFEHSLEPDVSIFGPVEPWEPLAQFNQYVTGRPAWRVALGL